MKRTRSKKSRDTVPLSKIFQNIKVASEVGTAKAKLGILDAVHIVGLNVAQV